MYVCCTEETQCSWGRGSGRRSCFLRTSTGVHFWMVAAGWSGETDYSFITSQLVLLPFVEELASDETWIHIVGWNKPSHCIRQESHKLSSFYSGKWKQRAQRGRPYGEQEKKKKKQNPELQITWMCSWTLREKICNAIVLMTIWGIPKSLWHQKCTFDANAFTRKILHRY